MGGMLSRFFSMPVVNEKPHSHVRAVTEGPTNPNVSTLSVDKTSIITLLVEPAQEVDNNDTPVKFYVHQRLLEECSSFFRMILSRQKSNVENDGKAKHLKECDMTATWKEGQTRAIELPEDRPEDVKMLLKWLKSGASKTNRLQMDSTPWAAWEAGMSSMFMDAQPGLLHTEIDTAVLIFLKYGSTPFAHSIRDCLPLPDLTPLVDLYILADKYDIESNRDFSASPEWPYGWLRRQIVQRVKVIWLLSGCVALDFDDIEKLWTNVPIDTEGEKGLKHAIFERLAREPPSTLREYFTVRSWMNDKEKERTNIGQGPLTPEQREDRIWPADFLRDLVVCRTFWEEDELAGAYRTIAF